MNLKISSDKCIKCNLCVNDCPASCIDINEYKIAENCIKCGHCIAICPKSAISNNTDPVCLNPNTIGFQDINSFITNIRTIRNYQDKEVSQETITKIIDSLKHAPSASNARKIEITVITNKEKIKELNDFTSKALLKKFTIFTSFPFNLLVKITKGKDTLNKIKSYKKSIASKIKENPNFICYSAPIVILLHYPKKDIGMHQADSYIWQTYITFIAKSFGLGTCINGFIENALRKNKIKTNFGIKKENEIGAALLLGYSNVEYKNQTQRNSPKIKWL